MTLGCKRIGHYGKPEEPFTVLLDVVAVQQPLPPLRHNRTESELAFDEWQGI